MKTTDPRDPLDQKIDKLLASQPVKVPTDFTARILTEVETEPRSKKSVTLAPLVGFALPLAAAVALAFIVLNSSPPGSSEAPAKDNALAASDTETGEALRSYEIQELFMLQEGLSRFAQIESKEFSSGSELLTTLETLYSI